VRLTQYSKPIDNRIAKQGSMEIAQTVITDIYTGMVVAKGNKEMLQVISDGLTAQQQDGRFKALAQKYNLPAEILIPVETRQ
jgi:ABC-type amino acid transport substrate-binding protein